LYRAPSPSRAPDSAAAILARVLFCYDNPPGSAYISGSQDAIGIAMPGLNKSHYEGEYWPAQITAVRDELTLRFVERHLYLLPLGPREAGFDVLSDTRIDAAGARALAEATDLCWKGILEHDLAQFGAGMRAAFEAQVSMFPLMLSSLVQETLDQHRDGAVRHRPLDRDRARSHPAGSVPGGAQKGIGRDDLGGRACL
jgi:hypothetical protein